MQETPTAQPQEATAPAFGHASESAWAVPVALAVPVSEHHFQQPLQQPPVVVGHYSNNCAKCLHITQIVFGCITLLVSLLVFERDAYSIIAGLLGLLVGASAIAAGCLYDPCGCCCCGRGPILSRQRVALVCFASAAFCAVDIIAAFVQYARLSSKDFRSASEVC